jgi:hypothetical protein
VIAEPVISSVTGRQLGDLPNMIQPPLLGVVNAASAISARTLTLPCAGRAAELLDAVGVHDRTAAPVPQIAAGPSRTGTSLDLDIAGAKRKGTAALDAVPLEGLASTLPSP